METNGRASDAPGGSNGRDRAGRRRRGRGVGSLLVLFVLAAALALASGDDATSSLAKAVSIAVLVVTLGLVAARLAERLHVGRASDGDETSSRNS